MAEPQDRAATMGDLANLAEHLTQQLATQSEMMRDQLAAMMRSVQQNTLGPGSVATPQQVQEMQAALSQLPYYAQVVNLIAALDQELLTQPGPITPEKVVPIAYKHLILKQR